jgi:hypothetical protein
MKADSPYLAAATLVTAASAAALSSLHLAGTRDSNHSAALEALDHALDEAHAVLDDDRLGLIEEALSAIEHAQTLFLDCGCLDETRATLRATLKAISALRTAMSAAEHQRRSLEHRIALGLPPADPPLSDEVLEALWSPPPKLH